MEKQLEYLLKNFSLFYNIEKYTVGYNSKVTDVSIIQGVQASFWSERRDIKVTDVVWKNWKGTNIPFLFVRDISGEIISFVDGRAIINYDIVASTFYFLSGWNELVNSNKDNFGRVKYNNSIIKALNISGIPVVNYYFDILREAIETIAEKDIKINRWGENKFAVSLTHDIDACKSAWIEGSFSELKKKRFFSIPKLIIKRLFNKDDWFNFNTIIDIERDFNASSTYYFLPRKEKNGNWKNADYNIKSKSVQNILSFLKTTQNEVGVHGSFGTHVNIKKFKTDIENINCNPISGNRFHFLMFDPEKTISVLEESGIEYDSSLSFAEQIGFRRATCYPFYLFNFEKDRISPVIEIPLIVMDSTLSNKKYLGLSPQVSLPLIINLVDEIKKFEGVFTILWHNTSFSEYKYTGWKDVYISTLDYCRKNNGLLATGKSIYEKIK